MNQVNWSDFWVGILLAASSLACFILVWFW